MRGRILYFRCKSNRFVSISKCRLRADSVATPRKGPKHGNFCAKVGGFDRRSLRFFDGKPRGILRDSTGRGRFSAVFYMLHGHFWCIILQSGACIPVFPARWIAGAVPLRLVGDRFTEDVRRTTGTGDNKAEFPPAQVGAERSEKGGRPRHAPEAETKMRNFPRFSLREMLYIRAFRFALSRFSTTFAVRFISPFMRMSHKRRPSRALPRPEK